MSLKTRFRPPALFLIDDKTMPYIRDPSRECLSNLSHLPEGKKSSKKNTIAAPDRLRSLRGFYKVKFSQNYSGRIGHRCPPYQFDCDPNRPLPLCVPLIALRNCRVDCPNMSDEWCGFGKVLCDTKLSGLPCGRCVRFEEMETRCRDHRWKALCNVSGSIKCSSTANCVLPQWLLDGKDDCGDGSDEKPCRLIECSTTTIASATSTTAATSVPPENSTPVGVSSAPGIRLCETGEFRCLSGECVEEGRVLDGVKDCWDSSDEKYCELVSEECSSESPCAYQPDIAAFGCGCAKGSVPDEKGICQPTKT